MKKNDKRRQLIDWSQYDAAIHLSDNKRHAAGGVWGYSLALVRGVNESRTVHTVRTSGVFAGTNQPNEETLLSVALIAALTSIDSRTKDAIFARYRRHRPSVAVFASHLGFIEGLKTGNVAALGNVRDHLSKLLATKFVVHPALDVTGSASRCREIERWCSTQFRAMSKAHADSEWLPACFQPTVVSALG